MDQKKSKILPTIPCGVALIRRGREFLIAQRMADDSFGSFWEFPGGKKNSGETFEACVAREVREELGIEVSVGRKFTEIHREHKQKIIQLHFYLCAHQSGEPRALECQRFIWADVADLSRYPFPPANEKVIQDLIQEVAGGR